MSVGSHFWRAWGLESSDCFQNILIFLLQDILRDFPINKRFGLWISSRLSWFWSNDGAWDECVFSSATLAAMGLNAAALQAEHGSLHELEAFGAASNPFWAIDSPDVLKSNFASLDAFFFPRPCAAARVRSLGSTQQLSGMGVMAGAAEALISLPSFESKGYNSQMPPLSQEMPAWKKGMIHHHDAWNSMPKITGAHAAGVHLQRRLRTYLCTHARASLVPIHQGHLTMDAPLLSFLASMFLVLI